MNSVYLVTQEKYRVKNQVEKPSRLHEPPTGPASAPGSPRHAHACRVVASPAPCRGQGPVISWPRPGRIVAEAPGRIAMLRAVSQTQCRSSLRVVLPPAPRARCARTPVQPAHPALAACAPTARPHACRSPRCLPLARAPAARPRAPACCHAQPCAHLCALSYCNTVCVLQYKSFLFKQQQSRYNVCIVTQPASPAKPTCNTILFIAIYF